MRKAKEFFYSDKLKVEQYKEADNQGIHNNINTTQEHINKTIEIAYIEGQVDGRKDCRRSWDRCKDVIESYKQHLRNLLNVIRPTHIQEINSSDEG